MTNEYKKALKVDVVVLTLDCSKIYFGQGSDKILHPELMARVIGACEVEAIRQGVGSLELERLIKAFIWLKRHLDYDCRLGIHFTVGLILEVASQIEPVQAASIRATPVTFQNGSLGLNPQLIQRALVSLAGQFHSLPADEFIKELLVIHPFADGNGRTAFALYNFITNRMTAPAPLQDYFGSEKANT